MKKKGKKKDEEFKKRVEQELERKTPKEDAVKKKPEWAADEDPEKIIDIITELEDFETRWTNWEQGFINNLQEKLENEQWVSKGQMKSLMEMREKYIK